MLGLRIENTDKNVPFDIFREKISNYIVRDVNNPEDMVSVVCDMIDSRSHFYNNNKPKGLTGKDKKFNINVQIHKQRIKLYLSFFYSGHRDQIACSLLGGFSKPRTTGTQSLDSVLCSM